MTADRARYRLQVLGRAAPDLHRDQPAISNLELAPFPHSGRVSIHAAAVIGLLTLNACANQEPPPVDNSFCLYVPLPDPADAVNLKVRGNKVAILTNEQNFQQWCMLGDRSKSMGPR